MTKISKSDFVGIVANIKNEIRTTQVRTMQQVNSNLIMMYFRVGKILHESSLNDTGFMREVATELKLELPNLHGFSERNLYNMREFYISCKDDEILQQAVAKLSWGHNLVLLSKIKDRDVRLIYAKACLENGWSRSVLEMQIESQYHLRIGNSTNNFKAVLPPLDSDMAEQSFKDPYIFDFLTLREGYKERELEKSMIERIRDVLLELGNGWSFMGNQYKITVGNKDYFVDLLFYHLKLRCYIAVELKATEYIPEFAGKMNFYLSTIDDLVKSDDDNPTIGLILCKEKDGFTAQYSLKDINKPIGVSSFETGNVLPAEILEQLPSEEELNLHIDVE